MYKLHEDNALSYSEYIFVYYRLVIVIVLTSCGVIIIIVIMKCSVSRILRKRRRRELERFEIEMDNMPRQPTPE